MKTELKKKKEKNGPGLLVVNRYVYTVHPVYIYIYSTGACIE